MLKGVDGDPDNPIRLDDNYIIEFLSLIPEAVASFNRVVPTMLVAEQDRLNILMNRVPNYTYEDPKVFNDGVQNRWNRAGVRPWRRVGQ